MTKLTTIFLSASALVLLGASGLSAQTRATADIPFEFTVQNTTLPAGSYTMSSTSPVHNTMLIRNNETRQAILVLASDSEAGYRRAGEKSVVVFHKAGDRYFLADVKTDAVCGHVGPSKLERELASNGGQQVAAVIVPAAIAR
jgi:hypothetical protein